MRTLCLFALILTLTGCVTEQLDERGNPVKPAELEDKLVIDDDGRIIARPTYLIPPDRIEVNGGTPTEREIRLLGVEGKPEDEAPVTYAKIQEWMANYLSKESENYIKPALDTDLDDRVIWGIVYLRAVDPETGEDIPDGYVNVNMAMLSQGLVQIRDLREFQDEDLRDRMAEAEAVAKREKRGLWSSKP
jgi:hypothetical protein